MFCSRLGKYAAMPLLNHMPAESDDGRMSENRFVRHITEEPEALEKSEQDGRGIGRMRSGQDPAQMIDKKAEQKLDHNIKPVDIAGFGPMAVERSAKDKKDRPTKCLEDTYEWFWRSSRTCRIAVFATVLVICVLVGFIAAIVVTKKLIVESCSVDIIYKRWNNGGFREPLALQADDTIKQAKNKIAKLVELEPEWVDVKMDVKIDDGPPVPNKEAKKNVEAFLSTPSKSDNLKENEDEDDKKLKEKVKLAWWRRWLAGVKKWWRGGEVKVDKGGGPPIITKPSIFNPGRYFGKEKIPSEIMEAIDELSSSEIEVIRDEGLESLEDDVLVRGYCRREWQIRAKPMRGVSFHVKPYSDLFELEIDEPTYDIEAKDVARWAKALYVWEEDSEIDVEVYTKTPSGFDFKRKLKDGDVIGKADISSDETVVVNRLQRAS